MSLQFTGKTFEKIFELSPINGFEPASPGKGRMPISNQLCPNETFERDRCASDWSGIYVHMYTNPVKPHCLLLEKKRKKYVLR